MKTFETEKHNIPEGATHYADETDKDFFAWVKFIGGEQWRIMPDSKVFNEWHCRDIDNAKPIPQTNIETPEEKEALDSMESVVGEEKRVEWASGDVAIYEGRHALVIAYRPHYPSVVIELPGNEYLNVLAIELSKPETPQQREEREREEEIYNMCASADNFTEESRFWAGKFYDLGYRKEG